MSDEQENPIICVPVGFMVIATFFHEFGWCNLSAHIKNGFPSIKIFSYF